MFHTLVFKYELQFLDHIRNMSLQIKLEFTGAQFLSFYCLAKVDAKKVFFWILHMHNHACEKRNYVRLKILVL